jgi:SAM-dependent methyltransferase
MQSLYSNGFEIIYDEMYQTFINYEEEFLFYSSLIKKTSVLEIGSGTGNLAKHFIKNSYNYQGLDYSQDMVNLAKAKNNEGHFLHGDMRDFKLQKPVESIIITGRSSSYLLNNKDVNSALKSIHSNLKPNGLLCFDFIDANRFLKDIKGGKTITHNAVFSNKQYSRDSYLNNCETENFMFNWDAKYFENTSNNKTLIAEDKSQVRAFTKNEWELFLLLNDFELIQFIDKPAYMFDTFVVVARKK